MVRSPTISDFFLDLLSDDDRCFQEGFVALGIPAAAWNPPRPTPVTERFCQFLLVEGASDPYGPRLATLLAGEWVYRDWASAAVPPPDPVYRRWVDLHATARFQGFVDWMRDELDALALSGTEEALVESRVIQVVAFEAQFWSEAPR